jgi:hypothetical protein
VAVALRIVASEGLAAGRDVSRRVAAVPRGRAGAPNVVPARTRGVLPATTPGVVAPLRQVAIVTRRNRDVVTLGAHVRTRESRRAGTARAA